METRKCLKSFLYLLLPFYGTPSSQPLGHIGCFNIRSFPKIDFKYFTTSMTGSACMESCQYVSLRYAATKGHYCFCIKGISFYTGSSTCNYKCPGKKTEICGGYNTLSIYDTWATKQTTIRLTTPNSTTKETCENTTTEQTESDTVMPEIEAANTVSTIEKNSVYTRQYDKDTGSRTDDLVSVYSTVPVLITITVAFTLVIIFWRKRRIQQNEQSDRPSTTGANSNDYLTVIHVDNYSYASIQDTLFYPSVVNADSKDVNDSLRSISLADTVQNEYVDNSYEELPCQREDNYY